MDTVLELTKKGHTSDGACDIIKRFYGQNLSVTKIIKKMQSDNKEYGGNGNPGLMV